MTHDYAVLLPEKVVISYRLASLGQRILAHFLDLVVFYGLYALFLVYAGSVLAGFDIVIAFSLALLIGSLGVFVYFCAFEALWNGQTPGKKALSLRVRMADGTAITPRAALLRNLLRPADLLPGTYLLGMVVMFVSEKSQRIGDLVAGTVVCHEPGSTGRLSAAPHRYGVHPLEEYVGELPRMTDEEYVVIKRLCDRFPELDPSSAARLSEQIWIPFAAKHGIRELPGVPSLSLMEAVVMSYGRRRGLL